MMDNNKKPNEGLKNIFKNKNSTSNVRTNVRHFVSNFVSEMKRKSPNAVQKWVDSIHVSGQNEEHNETTSTNIVPDPSCPTASIAPTPSSSTSVPSTSSTSCDHQLTRDPAIQLANELIVEGENEIDDDRFGADVDDAQTNSEDGDNGELTCAIASLTQQQMLESEQNDRKLCDKLNSNNNNSDNSNDNLRDKLKNLGKLKLNELYENLNLSKKKYEKILLNKKHQQQQSNINNNNNTNNSDNSVNSNNIPTSSDNNDEAQIINLHSHNLGDGVNTIASVDNDNTTNKLLTNKIDDNDNIRSSDKNNDKFMINTSAELLLVKNKNKHFNKRKINLGKIGRSFSETQPDASDRMNAMLCGGELKCFEHTNSESDFLMTTTDTDGKNCGGDDGDGIVGNNEFNTKLLSVLPPLSESNIHKANSEVGNSSNTLLLQLMHNTSKSVDNDAVRKHFTFSEKSIKSHLIRDNSTQSDSSHCSSVESLLESRKPDPEAILINLGFGPVETEDVLSKIPKRFLKPSQLKGIDTEEFVRQQKMASQVYENSVLGYRGLLGNPHISPSSIVAKIYERFQQNETNRLHSDENRPLSAPPTLDIDI